MSLKGIDNKKKMEMMVSFETYKIVTIVLGEDSLFSKDYKIYHNFIIRHEDLCAKTTEEKHNNRIEGNG